MSRKKKYARKKKNGTTYYFYRMKDPSSSWGFRDVYGKTVKELEEKIKKRQSLIDFGVVDQNVKFGEYFESIFDEVLIRGLKEGSKNNYRKPRKLIESSPLYSRKLVDLNPVMINNWLKSLDESNWALTKIGTLLRKTFKSAFLHGLIPRDLSNGILVPEKTNKTNNKRPSRLLSENEMNLFFERIDEPCKTLAFLLLNSGMRVGEALALDWDDIDLKTGKVSITKTLLGNGETDTPKTKNSVRVIPLDPETIKRLKTMRLEQMDEDYPKYIFLSDSTSPVFRNEYGRRLQYGSVLYSFKKTGLDISPHDFRETFASIAIEKGVNPVVVSSFLGHSTASTTLTFYTEMTEKLQAEGVEKLYGANDGAKH